MTPASVNKQLLKTPAGGWALRPCYARLFTTGTGQLLNTNADTIAAAVAVALAADYEVTLHYCFEKNGVLRRRGGR
ncbi:MAG: hypothetical protein WKG07_38295 [Hymenobacter sp.]